MSTGTRRDPWPLFPTDGWKDMADTLHMWTQVVGKVRLACSPWINHSWHVTLYVTPRGLTTYSIPHGNRTFQIDFDFTNHELVIITSQGGMRTLPLEPMTTSDFHSRLMSMLEELDVPVRINVRPNEVENPIPFHEDREHSSYDPGSAHRFWQVLVQTDRVLTAFRSRFIGKCSPVHFFWGSFDLAVTRFSGRTAPEHPGGFPNMPDRITREAYSHEVSSAGLWPGNASSPTPIFYSYAYPVPDGFKDQAIRPDGARWLADLGEFVLPYDAVRESDSPDDTLLEFLQTTYDAAARTGRWGEGLERVFKP